MNLNEPPFIVYTTPARHPQESPIKISDAEINRRARAETRNIQAQAFILGMQELRTAMSHGIIGDRDGGGDSRPPLKPLFDDVDSIIVRKKYLETYNKYLKFINSFIQEDVK